MLVKPKCGSNLPGSAITWKRMPAGKMAVGIPDLEIANCDIKKGGSMELVKAVQMIESVANGIHPETGEAFPTDSPYNSPAIIRALFACTHHLKNGSTRIKKSEEEKQAENKIKGLPLNAGLPWTKEARAELADLFKTGEAAIKLAHKFKRTKYAILMELKSQGLITEEDVLNLK